MNPHRVHRRRRARGFMMFEMLVALGVLAAFALIAVKLMTTSIKLSHDAAEADSRAIRFESALAALRADAWNMVSFDLPSPRTARLTRADGSLAVWSADAEGGLSRTLSAADGRGYPERRAWAALPPGLAFGQAEGVLLLVEPARAKRPRGSPGGDANIAAPAEPRRVPLLSQVSLARGKERP